MNLIPSGGANKRKYQKRKDPRECVPQITQEVTDEIQGQPQETAAPVASESDSGKNTENEAPMNAESDDEDLPDISIDFNLERIVKKKKASQRRRKEENHTSENVTDPVTDACTTAKGCSWQNVNEEINSDDFNSSNYLSQMSADVQEDTEIEVIDLCA